MDKDLEIFLFENQQGWWDWLEVNHQKSVKAWLRIAKKGNWLRSLTYEEALDAALCFGWIDAKRMSYDEYSYLQIFTPRKPTGGWSKINTEKAVRLIDDGKMQPSGLAAVQRAKENGSWDRAYDPQSRIEVPCDLAEELEKYPEALSFFESLDSRNRYAILHRLQTAKTEKTRRIRIEKYIEMLIDRKKLY